MVREQETAGMSRNRRFKLDGRKNFYTMVVAWIGLPSKVVQPLSLRCSRQDGIKFWISKSTASRAEGYKVCALETFHRQAGTWYRRTEKGRSDVYFLAGSKALWNTYELQGVCRELLKMGGIKVIQRLMCLEHHGQRTITVGIVCTYNLL